MYFKSAFLQKRLLKIAAIFSFIDGKNFNSNFGNKIILCNTSDFHLCEHVFIFAGGHFYEEYQSRWILGFEIHT